MAHKLNPTLFFKDMDEESKLTVFNYFNKMPVKKAFYEIVSHGDTDILEYFLLFTNEDYDINQMLMDVYHELKLKRVNISQVMEKLILKEIVYQSYSSQGLKETSCDQEDANRYIDYFNSTKNDICRMIEESIKLSEQYYKKNALHFVFTCLAGKINTAKKLYKSIIEVNRFKKDMSNRMFPWEQIQFMLSIFVYSYTHIEENCSSLFLSVITEKTLIAHLTNFLKHLKPFQIADVAVKTSNLNSKDKKKTGRNKSKFVKNQKLNCNEETVSNFCSPDIQQAEYCIDDLCELNPSSPDYLDLYRDFWLVKNVYSLNLIEKHIHLIITIDNSEIVEGLDVSDLVLKRCLLMIGEFTKCTPESPHLSQDIKDLVSAIMPSELQMYIKKIRDSLIHFPDVGFNDIHLIPTISQRTLNKIQEDFLKIKDSFGVLFKREKYKIIKHFCVKLLTHRSIETLDDNYPDYILDAIIHEINGLTGKCKRWSLIYPEIIFQKLKETADNSGSEDDRKSVNKISQLMTNDINSEELFSIGNETVYCVLCIHLRYLQSVKKNFRNNFNYETYLNLLDSIISIIRMNSNQNSYEIQKELYELIKSSQNQNIKEIAHSILSYIEKNLKSMYGIKYFKHNFVSHKSHKNNLEEAKNELYKILNFIRDNLSEQDCINNFNAKVNKEKGEYERIHQLIDTVKELNILKEKGCENAWLLKKLELAKILIGDRIGDLDKEMINTLKGHEFLKCLSNVLKKYKGNRQCRFEKLLRALFMKDNNESFVKKAELISDFFNFSFENTIGNSCDIKQIVQVGYLSIFKAKFELLEKISHLKEEKLIVGDIFYKPKLTAAAEMLVLEILEVSHKLVVGSESKSLFTFRPDILLHCGKSLRNYLAHFDIVYKLFSFDVELLLPIISKEMGSKDYKWIPLKNYLLRFTSEFDFKMEQKYFGEISQKLLSWQDRMFNYLATDDAQGLQMCLDMDADPRGTDVYRRNALQIAFDCSSEKCFELLVKRCTKILLCKYEHEASRFALSLEISTLPQMIKLVKLVGKFSLFTCNSTDRNDFNELENIYEFIIDKFVTLTSNVKIMDRIHVFVCFQAVESIVFYCQIGLLSSPNADILGYGAIHWAAAIGSVEICKILCSYGENLNVQARYGFSPLDLAIVERQWPTVEYLLELSAVKYNYFFDPLLLAIMNGHKDAIKTLLNMKSFINEDKHFNIILFSYALCYSDIDVIVKLFDYLDSISGNMIIDFIDFKTEVLPNNIFKQLSYTFIINGACFMNNKDIFNSILTHEICQVLQKHCFSLKVFDEFICYKHRNERQGENNTSVHMSPSDFMFDVCRLFRDNSLLHLVCLGGRNDSSIELIQCLSKQFDINSKNVDGFTPLLLATFLNKENECKTLINCGANVEIPTMDGLTPLHISSKYGFSSLTQILLLEGANIFATVPGCLRNPLHLASLHGHDAIVQILLKVKCEKNIVDVVDSLGFSALLIATSKGHKGCISVLIENGADILLKNNVKSSVIHEAAYNGQDDVLRLFLNKIPDTFKKEFINSFTEIDDETEFFQTSPEAMQATMLSGVFKMETPLYCAANSDVAKLLLKCGAEVNLKNSFNETPLHRSAKYGNLDVAATLVSWNGCEVDPVDCWGSTPLSSAVVLNYPDIVDLLLDNQADMTRLVAGNFFSFEVAHSGDTDVAYVLLQHDAFDINETIDNVTLVMISSLQGHTAMTRLLLERGAPINRTVWDNPLTLALMNHHTETACALLESYSLEDLSNPNLPYLHYAIHLNNAIFIDKLLTKGVSPNIRNIHDIDALAYAAIHGHIDCLKILIKHGADLDAKSGEHKLTPLEYAAVKENYAAAVLLMDCGATVDSSSNENSLHNIPTDEKN